MFDSLQPHEPQHARPPCPSPTHGVYSNSCPLSRWCYPTISSSVVPFSSCLQSFLASGSLPMSQFFASWPKYWSFSFSISPSSEYSGLISFRMDWFDFLAVQGTLCQLGHSEILDFKCKCIHKNVVLNFSFSPCSHRIYILKIFFSFIVLRVTKSHGEVESIQSLVKVNIFTWEKK